MVVNGSKSGKKPLLPFFFELWSNIKKRRKSTRYRAFSAVFIFLEHFLFLEWSTSLVRNNKRRERDLRSRRGIQQIEYADMAQEVEHVLGKDEVAGSNPAISSTKYHHIWWYFSIFPPKYGIFETFLATSRKKSRYNCIRIADFFGQK